MAKSRSPQIKKNKKSTVFILDEYPIVRRGFTQLINGESGLVVCGEAADGPETLAAIQKKKPDLIIMDIALKNESGLELIKTIKTRYPNVHILIASIYDEDFYAERALNAGAKGYVMKSQAAGTILKAVRRILEGGVYLSEEASVRILQKISTGDGGAKRSSIDLLSDRELEVFRLIGTGIGTRQIADHMKRSIKTIEAYRERIKKKLNLKNASELNQAAIRWT